MDLPKLLLGTNVGFCKCFLYEAGHPSSYRVSKEFNGIPSEFQSPVQIRNGIFPATAHSARPKKATKKFRSFLVTDSRPSRLRGSKFLSARSESEAI
jgi:hypothetical protein